MRLIEPCCASKHFILLRDAIGTHGKAAFEGYGDMSLTEFLPALLTRYSETTMMIEAPTIPDQAADIIYQWLAKTWARMDGKGRLNVLAHLTIMADLSETASPTASAWLKDNPFPDRLTLVNKPQDDTVLLLPDIAVIGPLNFRYGDHFICEATTIADEVQTYWKDFSSLADSAEDAESSSSDSSTDPIKPIDPIEPTTPSKAKSKKTPKMTKASKQ